MSLRGQRFAFPSRGFVGVLMSASDPKVLWDQKDRRMGSKGTIRVL